MTAPGTAFTTLLMCNCGMRLGQAGDITLSCIRLDASVASQNATSHHDDHLSLAMLASVTRQISCNEYVGVHAAARS